MYHNSLEYNLNFKYLSVKRILKSKVYNISIVFRNNWMIWMDKSGFSKFQVRDIN